MPCIIDELVSVVAQQIVEIDALRDQVHNLNLALGYDKVSNVQSAFGVSATLARMLIVLAEGKAKNKDQLHAAIYFEQPDNSRPEIKILDTQACKLRKHLKPFGVQIATVWSGGYRISAGLDVVRAAVECGLADPAVAKRLRRLKRERERQRRIRVAQGCLDRQTYLQKALSRHKPWLELGISRRTWERRHRKLASPEAHEETLAARRAWTNENREIEQARRAQDRAENGPKRNETKRRRHKQRAKSDPCYKLQLILRKRLHTALKGNFKKGSAVKLLGCTIPELKARLEGMWLDGMTWENHGQWHIDHIEALATFDLLDPEQLARACHYSNLQPLWALDNMRKGKRAAGLLAANSNDLATSRITAVA